MSAGADQYVLVLTNLPDREAALELARTLVEKRLVACVNVLAACTSVYRWKAGVQTESEVPVLLKTHRARYESVQQEILALHPYELPEIIAVPIHTGQANYLKWIDSSLL